MLVPTAMLVSMAIRGGTNQSHDSKVEGDLKTQKPWSKICDIK